MALVIGSAIALLPGCQLSPAANPYGESADVTRDPAEAQRLNGLAIDVMDTDPVEAADLLRRALVADLFYGPAHNNLGVLHLTDGRLYEAASEFEWARKLMPGHPDPRLNLAMTLERAGRVGEALDAYRSAVVAMPTHVPSVQALTRAELRHGHADDPAETRRRLETIAVEGSTEQWRRWARELLAKG